MKIGNMLYLMQNKNKLKRKVNIMEVNKSICPICGKPVNDNITMNRKWKIKMYKNDH